MPGGTGQILEDGLDPGRQAATALGEPALEQRQIGLVPATEIGRDQIVLAVEMIIQRALGDAGGRRHRVDAHALDALAVEQLARRSDDALTCIGFGSCHAGYVYRPVNIHNMRRIVRWLAAEPGRPPPCRTACCSISKIALVTLIRPE